MTELEEEKLVELRLYFEKLIDVSSIVPRDHLEAAVEHACRELRKLDPTEKTTEEKEQPKCDAGWEGCVEVHGER